MSSLYHFFRRHRRKFVWGGAAVGGLLIAARVMERQMIKAREEEAKDALERARKRNHYEATECTCKSTITHLYTELKARILEAFDSSKLQEALRSGPSAEEKIRIWNEIKIVCFCKLTSSIIAQAFLGILVKIQLNIIAGYLFTERVSVPLLLNNNRDPEISRFPARLQEKFLNISQYFINEGLTDLSEVLLVNIKSILDNVPLQEKLKIGDIENIFHRILESVFSESSERNLLRNPGKFLLSSTQTSTHLARELKEEELETFKSIVSDTLEIMESQEVTSLLRRLCRQGFAHYADNLTDFYTTFQENLPQDESPERGRHRDDFVSPCRTQVPLAKLIPILSSLVAVKDEDEEEEEVEEEEDEWLAHIRENGDLKVLGANVYETYCVRDTREEENASWMQYISSSISSFF